MGTWAASIFSDDDAAETRDRYRDLLRDGATPSAAVKKLKASRADLPKGIRALTDPVFWIALAATQLELRQITPDVKKAALRMIDGGKDLAALRELEASPAFLKRRENVTRRLREKLIAHDDATPPIKPRAPRTVPVTHAVGDVLAYRLPSGRLVLLHVLDINRQYGQGFARLLTWNRKSPPSAETCASLPRFIPPKGESRRALLMLSLKVNDGPPPDRVTLVANVPVASPPPPCDMAGAPWDSFAELLAEDFGVR